VRAVLLEVPESMIAERRRLGLDSFDEMWEGELHMVPAPKGEHQRFGSRLLAYLLPVAERAGLIASYETGLYDPAVAGETSYRIPDLAVYPAAVVSDRGIEGGASLVIEIASPGDESLAKVSFYSRVGVGEMVRIDRDSKEVRRWARAGDAGLEEVPAGPDGWHRLAAVPVALRGGDWALSVEVDGQVHPI
jgi:Uma2 family endonuclease